MGVRERFEALAAQWEADGRPESGLVSHEWELLQLVCWCHSDGVEADSISDSLAAYVSRSRDIMPSDWYDELLEIREYCSGCREQYRVENLSLCTDCEALFCYRCTDDFPEADNGNLLHSCGGEIVG